MSDRVIYMNKENEQAILNSMGATKRDIDYYSVTRGIVDLMTEYNQYIWIRNQKKNLAFGIRNMMANTYEDFHLEKWLASFYGMINKMDAVSFPIDLSKVKNEGGQAFFEQEGEKPTASYYDNLRAIRNKVQHVYNNFLDIAKTQVILKLYKPQIIKKTQELQVEIVKEAITILKATYNKEFFIAADIMDVLEAK